MFRSQPKLRNLRMALAVSRSGRFAKAAEQLGITQPAITRSIVSLEAELGFTLFNRSTTHVAITPVGRVMIDRVERAFRRLETAIPKVGTKSPLIDCADHELTALIAVDAHKSISRAARSLDVSQPAVSKSLLTLERRIGQRLYARVGHDLVAEPATPGIVRNVKLAFSELRQAEDEVAFLAGQRAGRLTIGALPLARSSLVPLAVLKTCTHYPEADISIVDGTYDSLLAALREGDLDIIVGSIRTNQQDKSLRAQVLFEDSLVIAASKNHPLASAATPCLDDAMAYKWVLPSPHVPVRNQFEALVATRGLSLPGGAITTDSIAVLRATLLNSDRLGLASLFQVQLDVRMGLLALLPIIEAPPHRMVGTTMRHDHKPTALLSQFMKTLEELASGFHSR